MKGMNARNDIETWGFFPEVVDRALRRALGGCEPIALIHQIDAAFDRGSMFRHLTVAALGEHVFVHIHVDELEGGAAGVTTAVHPLSELRGLSIGEVVASPERGGAATEITVSLNMGSQHRTEIEPARCDDPECPADHGYSASSFPDDFTLRVSQAADGAETLRRAQHFVDTLSAALVATHRV